MTGIPDDALSFWLKRGLLGAAAGNGKGTARRFDAEQIKVAAILGAARGVHAGVGFLRELDAYLQTSLARFREVQPHPRWMAETVGYFEEMGTEYKEPFDKAFAWMKDHGASDDDLNRIRQTLTRLEKGDGRFLYMADMLLRDARHGILVATERDDGSFYFTTSSISDHGLDARVAIVFGLERIINAIDWDAASSLPLRKAGANTSFRGEGEQAN